MRASPGRPVVAVVADSIAPFHKGGKEMRYHELLRRLSRDAEVHVYTMNWWGDGRDRTVDGARYHAIAPNVALYAHGRRSLWQATVFGLACARLLGARFDVVEADHIPYVPLFVLRAVCTVRRRPLVVTWHEVWGPQAWRDYLGRLGRVAWLVERSSMRLPDRVVAASEATAERLQPYVRRTTAVSVAPNGLDLELLDRVPAAAERTDLVFVGRLLAHKHADLVVAAVALLRDRGTSLTCRVVGRGPELAALRAQAEALGVSDLVEFRPDVDEQEELYSLIKAGGVFVFPSVREGFGIAVLEAVACGLPVVTTDAPDNLSRLLVDPDGPDALCEPTAQSVADAIESVRARVHVPDGDVRRRRQDRDPAVGQYDWDRVTDVVAAALGVPRG